MANALNALKDLLKIFPFIFKGLKFLFITLPKTIFKIIKLATRFVKKSIPLLFSVILMYFIIFLGIQVFLKHVTDTPDLIPHLGLVLFTLYIIYQLVMYNSIILQRFQDYIFKLFLLLFGNIFVKRYFKFPFNLSEKPTLKNLGKLSLWIVKNPINVIFTLFIYYFILKLFFIKFFSTIASYFQDLFDYIIDKYNINTDLIENILLIFGFIIFILILIFIMIN